MSGRLRSIAWGILLASSSGVSASAQSGGDAPATPAIPTPTPRSAFIDALNNPEGFDQTLLTLPDLRFEETAQVTENYDKYFVFYRPSVSFATAVRDIVECDANASGMSNTAGENVLTAAVPYGAAGLVGGALVAAILGSAESRRLRRANMRRCMSMKGYARYGIAEGIWRQFHFEEGLATEAAGPRARALLIQAMVASAATPPQGRELGL